MHARKVVQRSTPRGGGRATNGIASTRRSVSRVLSRAASRRIGDGHPSVAAGRPTAHAAYPRAGQRTSPPLRSPGAGCALLFGLAPGGVCRVSLRHPTRKPGDGIVTVALVLVSRRTGVTRHPALAELGLSSRRRR